MYKQYFYIPEQEMGTFQISVEEQESETNELQKSVVNFEVLHSAESFVSEYVSKSSTREISGKMASLDSENSGKFLILDIN